MFLINQSNHFLKRGTKLIGGEMLCLGILVDVLILELSSTPSVIWFQ